MAASVPVARRNILADRRRLAISVLGVGAAIALILLLQGLWSGFRVQISAYEDNVGADLFVGEPGTRNFFGVPSVLPLEALSAIRAVPEVDRADPVAVRFVVLDLHGRKQSAILVGSARKGMGGPWDVVAGRDVSSDYEAVMDRSLADQHGIGLGEYIEAMGERFRVVGFSAGTRSWMAGFVFTSHGTVERLLSMPGTTSFVLVKTGEPGVVAEAIEDRTGLTALAPSELGDNDRELIAGIMGGPLYFMLLIAFVAGTLIVALTVYSAIVERIREYGIAKAMGARRGRLLRIVLSQTLIVATLGTAAGYLVFLGASQLLVTLRPQMWVRLSAAGAVAAAIATALMALLAAAVPTRRVAHLDPASVYRG